MAERTPAEGRRPARSRWAIFSASVVSAVDNPDAYLLRALGRLLVRGGHEVTFYEERSNSALVRLLQREGARGLDAFRRAYPDITYRTIERRAGADLVEWLTRTLATVDVALVQTGAPTSLATWVGRLTRPHLRTYLLDTGWGVPPEQEETAAREPGNFSGVFAGPAADLAGIPPDKVRPIEALPDLADLDGDDALVRLRPAAERLAHEVLADLTQGDRGGFGTTAEGPSTQRGRSITR